MTEDVDRPAEAPLVKFFGLTLVVSTPFLVLGAAAGRLADWLPENLPTSALMACSPLIAATILVYRAGGSSGLKGFLMRTFDFKRTTNRIWYLPVVFVFPVVMLPLTYAVMRLLGRPLPDPDFAVATVPPLVFTFFIAGFGEELGWTGYATDPMQRRWGALAAAVMLGAFGAAWHITPYIQGGNNATWITGQCLFTVASRVIIVWLYYNTGRSVFAAIVLHTMSNVSWILFPNEGSHYDPLVTGVIMTVLAVIVAVWWGPRTLTRRRAMPKSTLSTRC